MMKRQTLGTTPARSPWPACVADTTPAPVLTARRPARSRPAPAPEAAPHPPEPARRLFFDLAALPLQGDEDIAGAMLGHQAVTRLMLLLDGRGFTRGEATVRRIDLHEARGRILDDTQVRTGHGPGVRGDSLGRRRRLLLSLERGRWLSAGSGPYQLVELLEWIVPKPPSAIRSVAIREPISRSPLKR